ncbi:hypothetical protein GAY28_27590, partial [Azospirillum brasilense]|nr:hypothetical protein [Azospirillum brasilense]
MSHLAGALMATTALGGAAVWTAPALAQTPPAAQAPLPFALPAQPLPAAIDAFPRTDGGRTG